MTADTLNEGIFNFPARRQKAVKRKMALTSQQSRWCVLEFHKTNSVVTVQRAFKLEFNADLPTNKSILKLHKNFTETGRICDQRKGHSGRQSVSDHVVDRVTESFLRSPWKLMRRARRVKGPAKHRTQDLTQTLAVTPLQAAIGPKVTPERQGNVTCILRESPSVNGK